MVTEFCTGVTKSNNATGTRSGIFEMGGNEEAKAIETAVHLTTKMLAIVLRPKGIVVEIA